MQATGTLHFVLKERPANLNAFRGNSYLGKIEPDAKVCWVSFPGKFEGGWESLISTHHKDSVACVFLDDPQHGLGKHHFPDPNDPDRCRCAEIYGPRDEETFKYLKEVKEPCTEEEQAKLTARAKAMNVHIVFGEATEDDKKKAKELWRRHQKRAPWGCQWFEDWFQRVQSAVARNQRLKVVYFPGEVGRGKVAWKELPFADLWDGKGCGGSQKAEIAKLDEMRRAQPSGKWDYDQVDVTRFLAKQFEVGQVVDAMDPKKRNIKAKILRVPGHEDPDEIKWEVKCVKTEKVFETNRVRYRTETFEKLLEALGQDSLKKIFEDAIGLKVKTVDEMRLQNGDVSLAVKVDVQRIQEAHRLRDVVLSDELNAALAGNKALTENLGEGEELAVKKTLFFDQYATSLLTFSEMTPHQKERLEELSQFPDESVHLTAPAGSGKTFLALRFVLSKIKKLKETSSGAKILYVSPSRPLIYHFVRWLLMHAKVTLHDILLVSFLERIVVMHQPYKKSLSVSVRDRRIILEELAVEPQDVALAIFDEAHEVFRTEGGLFQKIVAQQKLILSDISQSHMLGTVYPDLRLVRLSEIVRSTKRVTLGAGVFQLQDAEAVSCLGNTGPPLKSFIFEVSQRDQREVFAEFAKYTLKAFWHLMQSYPGIRIEQHVALLVPTKAFYDGFKPHLVKALHDEFSPTRKMRLVSFEESLRCIPQAEHDRGEDDLILDWDDNAKGLEHLFIIGIGLDQKIVGNDNVTRAQLYHAVTRAQLQALIVDQLVDGGWLQFLATLKLSQERFVESSAALEVRKDAARKVVEDAWLAVDLCSVCMAYLVRFEALIESR